MMEKISHIFLTFLYKNGTVAVVILAVLLARLFLRKMPKKYSYLLWSIVGIRMLFTLPVTSRLSIFNLFRTITGRTSTAETMSASGNHAAGTLPASGIANPFPADGSALAPTTSGQTAAAMHPTTTQTLFGILGFVWLIGIGLFAAYGICAYIRCQKQIQTAVLANDIVPVGFLPKRRKTTVTVWECDRIPSPFVLGIFHPRIYLPFRMPKQEQTYILAHETCHIRRFDPLWKLIAFLLLAVYWWNPFAWIAFLYMVRDMEMSCDEAVIEQFGTEIKQGYSNSLLSFAMERHPYSFAPVAFGESDAGRRIKNVLHFKKPQTWAAIVVIILLVIVGVSCLTNRKDNNNVQHTQQNDSEITSTESLSGTEADTEMTEQSATTTTPDSDADDPAFTFAKARLKKWAEAFCRRDVQLITSMTSDDAKADMKKENILDDNSGFGWSSPWPQLSYVDNKLPGWNILDINTKTNTATILYYAWTSDPHVTVWEETLQYTLENDIFTITGESLWQYDQIASGAEFDEAYPKRLISTPMDYRENGLGETLNDHAMSANGTSPDGQFDLTDPAQAATYFLNLLPDKVEVTTRPDSNSDFVVVNIHFKGEKDQSNRTVVMRPFTTGGIWIVDDKTR